MRQNKNFALIIEVPLLVISIKHYAKLMERTSLYQIPFLLPQNARVPCDGNLSYTLHPVQLTLVNLNFAAL